MSVVWALLGLGSIAYGVTVMMLNSGTSFFAVWYAIGCACLAIAWLLHAGIWSALPAMVRYICVGLFAALALLLGGALALIASQLDAKGEPDLDYLIVLGAQIYSDGSPSPVLQYRLDVALAYLEENPDTKCIVSGGQGPNEPYPEAEGMAAYLVAHGIADERIIREGRSTNTVQNVSYSMALMDAPDDSVGVVTNNFHVYRAIHIARKAGLSRVCGVAGYSTPWYMPNNLLRECLGLVKDFAVGNLA